MKKRTAQALAVAGIAAVGVRYGPEAWDYASEQVM